MPHFTSEQSFSKAASDSLLLLFSLKLIREGLHSLKATTYSSLNILQLSNPSYLLYIRSSATRFLDEFVGRFIETQIVLPV